MAWTFGSRLLGARARRGAFAAFALVARSLQQISALVITLLAARFLMPAEYGIYSLGIVFIMLIQTLTYTGFYHFIVTSKEDEAGVLSTSFWMICGLATGAAALLALFAYPIAWAFDAPELALVLIFLAAIQPMAGAGAWSSAVLLRQKRLGAHFSIMFAQNFAALVGGVVLLYFWQSLFALVAFRYVRVITGAVLYVAILRTRPRLRFDRGLARRATNFSGGLYGSRFLGFLSRYAGDLLLGLTFSTAEAGLYRFGNRVASGATDVVTQPMTAFALTQFGAAGRAGRSLGQPLERFVGTFTILVGGIAAIIIVFAETAVEILFDPAYLGAVVVAYAMALRAVASMGRLLLEPGLAAAERTGVVFRFNLVWAAITVVAIFVAAPFGLFALAWSQAGVTAVSTLAAFAIMNRRAGIDVRGGLRAFGIALALVSAYGVLLWLSWSWIAAGLSAAGMALVLGLLWALVLGLAVLLAGRALGVFTLGVFSG